MGHSNTVTELILLEVLTVNVISFTDFALHPELCQIDMHHTWDTQNPKQPLLHPSKLYQDCFREYLEQQQLGRLAQSDYYCWSL